mmetsp:Transcript_18835/g.42370  ORF Transcript_18835/g.42370 Transcript_18835/m.42370 type:complete len:95 (+) Transcript_18835:1-285(+)
MPGAAKTAIADMDDDMKTFYTEAGSLISAADSELPFLNGTTEAPSKEVQDWFKWAEAIYHPDSASAEPVNENPFWAYVANATNATNTTDGTVAP